MTISTRTNRARLRRRRMAALLGAAIAVRGGLALAHGDGRGDPRGLDDLFDVFDDEPDADVVHPGSAA